MATITTRVSDLSGDKLAEDTPKVYLTLEFGDETDEIELDLTDAELADLRELVKVYFDKGTEPVKAVTKIAPTQAEIERKAAVRKWAMTNPGFTWNGETVGEVKAQGRMNGRVYRLYDHYVANAAQVDAEDAAKAAATEHTANGDGNSDAVTAPKPGPKTAAKSAK